MKRYYITIGDKTTVGGTVVTGSPTSRLNGKQRAREGDQIDCSQCGATGVIQLSGERLAANDASGKVYALNDDLCICKCHPPPKLLASQSTSGCG